MNFASGLCVFTHNVYTVSVVLEGKAVNFTTDLFAFTQLICLRNKRELCQWPACIRPVDILLSKSRELC